MNVRALGVYREVEFSPGKVEADAAILDAVLKELSTHGVETSAIDAARFSTDSPREADLVLAMCQGEKALSKLASLEKSGAVAVNSALAIRNCYRDLLSAGLMRAGVHTPKGALVPTMPAVDPNAFDQLDLSKGVFVKRGDLHALGPGDVQRVEDREKLAVALLSFARRGVKSAYLQQAVEGRTVKFYGVSGGEYFTALAEEGQISEDARGALAHAASGAADALGLETWGGDAIVSGEQYMIVDFNDWPSYSRVRREAARAIARRCMALLRRQR